MGNNQDQKNNKLEQVIKSFKEQVKTLQDIIEEVKTENPEAEFPKHEDEEEKKDS